ncbi:MAG: ABC transporter permease subunit [Archaeoglobales archaeon]|nr:ABC transporter permease subunit [Archaeoglobales archaeon]
MSHLLANPGVPTPERVLIALISDAKLLLFNAIFSLSRVLYSISLAVSLAFPVGILSREKLFDRIVSPFIYLLYPIPHIVLLPVYILLFGIGDLSRIALIATILFFQMVVTIRDATKNISEYYIYSALSLGASKFDIYRYIIIPAILPQVLTALRISIGTAIAVLFFAESFATRNGLGYLIIDAWSRADYEMLYAGIVSMALLGLLLYILLDLIEKKVKKWV